MTQDSHSSRRESVSKRVSERVRVSPRLVSLREKRVRVCLSERRECVRVYPRLVSLRGKRVRVSSLGETHTHSLLSERHARTLFSRRDTHALSSLGEKRVSERHALEENSCLREHSKRVRVSFLGETRTHSLLSERHTRTLFSRRDTHALSSLGETRVRVSPRLSERVLAWMQSLQSLCHTTRLCYGAATVSRADKIIGLFCKRAL